MTPATSVPSDARRVPRWRCAMAALLAAVVSCSSPPEAISDIHIDWLPMSSVNEELPPGIRAYEGANDSIPLRAWYVRIRESAEDITTRVVMSDDTTDNRETVSSFARELDACVAVNGGYFNMSVTPARHGGLLLTDGTVIEPATRFVKRDSLLYETARAAIGFVEDGVQIGWVSSSDNVTYVWPSPPAHEPGEPAEPLDYELATEWSARDALSAGPALVVAGEIEVTTDEEVFFGSSIPDVHPRSAAGRTSDGDLLIMVVDGRQDVSRGVYLQELAALLRDVGAVDALNLDGGGSSALVVNGNLINRPAGSTTEREVMSALVTLCR